MDWNIFVTSLLGTLIGGFISIIGGYFQIKHENKTKQEDEKRKEKIQLLKDIIRYKKVLGPPPHNKEDLNSFLETLDLIPLVFSDEKNVTVSHNSFLLNRIGKIEGDENELFYDLIVSMYLSLNLTPPTYEQSINIFSIK